MNRVSQVIWTNLLPQSPVFSTATVAKVAGIGLPVASRDLAKLEREGVITRITRGLWAVPTHPDFSPYAVVPQLFSERPGGYVSLLSALNLHGMIEQIPRVVHVVATRQRPHLNTPVGAYEFYRIQPALFSGFKPYQRTGNFDIAMPEKALFDALYFSARKGRRFRFLPEIGLPEGFSVPGLQRWIRQVDYEPLRIAVQERWERLAEANRFDSHASGRGGPSAGTRGR